MFDGVLLTDTFVLAWHQHGDDLVFEVYASLWPGHPEYEPPRPGEWTCYKRARLVFGGVSAVNGLPASTDAARYRDRDGGQDLGSLNELAAEPGGYRIVGDFGIVHVQARSVRLEVGPSAAPRQS